MLEERNFRRDIGGHITVFATALRTQFLFCQLEVTPFLPHTVLVRIKLMDIKSLVNWQ